jgi:hypothetical protein
MEIQNEKSKIDSAYMFKYNFEGSHFKQACKYSNERCKWKTKHSLITLFNS